MTKENQIMIKYVFESGARIKADPQMVGEELAAAMASREGKLETADLVELASDPDTELHKCFTWDDCEAAQRHRLWEARRLIRSVKVVHHDDSPAVPLAINVRLADGQHYSTPDRLRANHDEGAAATRAAASRLDAAYRSMRELEEALGETENAKRANRGARLVDRARQHVGLIQANP